MNSTKLKEKKKVLDEEIHPLSSELKSFLKSPLAEMDDLYSKGRGALPLALTILFHSVTADLLDEFSEVWSSLIHGSHYRSKGFRPKSFGKVPQGSGLAKGSPSRLANLTQAR